MKSKKNKNKNKNKNKSKGSSRLLHYPSEITEQLSNLLYKVSRKFINYFKSKKNEYKCNKHYNNLCHSENDFHNSEGDIDEVRKYYLKLDDNSRKIYYNSIVNKYKKEQQPEYKLNYEIQLELLDCLNDQELLDSLNHKISKKGKNTSGDNTLNNPLNIVIEN